LAADWLKVAETVRLERSPEGLDQVKEVQDWPVETGTVVVARLVPDCSRARLIRALVPVLT